MSDTDIVERLNHAKVTAQNDDYSQIGDEKRKRHVARMDTIDDAVVEFGRMRTALEAIAEMEPGSRGAYTKFARAVFLAKSALGRP